MLKLYLLRHGKASKHSEDRSDFTRPLNKEGTAQINQIGYLLREKQVKVGQLISSSAKRTEETARIVNHFLDVPKIELEEAFYMASYEKVMQKLISMAKEKNVMYVGHNNAISDLAGYLTGKPMALTTGQLVEIQFNTDNWQEISADTGTIASQLIPDIYSF